MQGFHSLVGAMVLQSVNELSDDESVHRNNPAEQLPTSASSKASAKHTAEPKKVKAKQKAKAKSSPKLPKPAPVPKPEPLPVTPLKRPASASKAGNGTMKRPATTTAAGVGTDKKKEKVEKKSSEKKSSEPPKIYKYRYKESGKYGFKIDGKERFSVT